MKNEVEMRKYLEYQGVTFIEPIYDGVAKLRVMDLTQVPSSMREQFDERGFFMTPEMEAKPKGGKK